MERKELIEMVECIRYNIYTYRGCAYIKGAKPSSVEWVLDNVINELKNEEVKHEGDHNNGDHLRDFGGIGLDR